MTDKAILQSIFDAVAKHFQQMPRSALNADGDCVYRCDDGNRCFVGALIKDELYDPRIEGLGVSQRHPYVATDLLNEALLKSLADFGVKPDDSKPFRFPQDVKRLLAELQDAHDTWGNDDEHVTGRRYVRGRMIEIAGHFGLSAAVLDEEVV